ncbi:DeoR/GlpR family DNA-binding transcription regulator [Devosia chinhatensis]|uniref:DeoR faimly transcriptional regulator n=1 Tax=Devosia chinhatensis TaxID=429727 RepID=A0A0F5FJB9_9HYPH|nr:DeoR/GlpR family DNA-binding transcription regulator [Devosia chinhatensis]KKB08941.1 DeoR faimly transcriptional regulator [Devosia chinhatensis]
MLSVRQRDILSLIEAEGAQYIEALSERFGLTTQTIRRDINALCDLGYAKRFHGGVDAPVGARNISISARASLNNQAKQRIGRRVAAAIEPGSTVSMGIGSTVRFVAQALRNHERLRVVTNNLDVALILCDAPQIELHMTGGVLRHDDRDVVGTETLQFFKKFYASYAVVGAGALDADKGVLDFSYSEAETTTTLLANARTRLLVADASKWERNASMRVVPFSDIDCLFTDHLPAGPATEALETAKTDVVLCGADKP